jgi:hypothetical protein
VKTFRRLFDELASFENLHAAYRAARRGKRGRADVASFELRWEEELLDIRRELLEGAYRFGPYREFMVTDPKERQVAAAPFRDRVVHHALVRILEPIYERCFICDTYACRRGRGTHRAVLKCQSLARKWRFALKADVWKFYPTVDHEVLLATLGRRVGDARVLGLARQVLATWRSGQEYYRPFPGDDLFSILRPCGIPIGNLTSQFFANVYLAKLDEFVKRVLGVKPYLRYMDDLVLFAEDPETLRAWRAALSRALVPLRLVLHPTKCHIVPTARGVPFLGYRILPARRLLLRSGVRRFVRRTRRQIREVEAGRMERAALGRSVHGWIPHAAFADSLGLRRSIFPRLFGAAERDGPEMPYRVLRGGSWNNDTTNLRCAQRNNNNPTNRNNNNGLRCAKTLSCRIPARRGGRGRALNVHGPFRAHMGRIERDGSPCGRPLGADARRPDTIFAGGAP